MLSVHGVRRSWRMGLELSRLVLVLAGRLAAVADVLVVGRCRWPLPVVRGGCWQLQLSLLSFLFSLPFLRLSDPTRSRPLRRIYQHVSNINTTNTWCHSTQPTQPSAVQRRPQTAISAGLCPLPAAALPRFSPSHCSASRVTTTSR